MQPDNKNVYTDKFLDKDIKLTPDAYDVYKTYQEAKKNTTKTASTFKKPTRKKEFVDSTANSYKDFDYKDSFKKGLEDFDFTMFNQVENNSESKFNSNFSQQNRIPRPNRNRSSSFKIFWGFISICTLLATIWFYLQGLQPVLLNQYVQQSQGQISELRNVYNDQTKSYVDLQKNIFQNFAFDVNKSCSEHKLYTTSQEDTNKIQNLQEKLFPQTKYKDLQKYKIFSYYKVSNSYHKLYQKYTILLDLNQSKLSNLYFVVDYLAFRSTLTDICKTFLESTNFSPELTTNCTILTNEIDKLTKSKTLFISQISSRLAQFKQICSNLNANNYNQSKTAFVDNYNQIMKIVPNLENDIKDWEKYRQDFLETETNKTKQEIEEIYRNKLKFENSLYLLQIY